MTAQPTAAWQTYHEQARRYLADLAPVEHPNGSKSEPILTPSDRANIALAWSVLALVEVMQPPPVVELAVTDRQQWLTERLDAIEQQYGSPCPMLPRRRCDIGGEHQAHQWGSAPGTQKWCDGAGREQRVVLCSSADTHLGHEWVLRAGCADEERVWCEGV